MVASLSEQVQQWTSAAVDFGTLVALGVGGWWTYTRFISGRENRPRAEISLDIDHRRLNADAFLAHVQVTVHSSGTVLLPLSGVRCDAYQVAPPHPETLTKLDQRQLVPDYEADLFLIRHFEREWAKGEAEIEPGESDTSAFDFVIDSDIETVLVYAYVCNSTKSSREIGWECSRFYDLTNAEKGGHTSDV